MKNRKFRLLLVLAGLAISIYLTYLKTNSNPFWCDFGQCGVVQTSSYSVLFGIPVASWGAAYYVALGALILKNAKKPLGWILMWGIAFSTYLTYIEIFVLKAICGWCVLSFAIILLISFLNYDLPRSRSRRIRT